MSKGNMLLGQARGKVGSLVFSRNNGQQVTRSRAEVVKNPKTTKQIMQRVILNTVAQSYSVMQPIVDHSFEGVQAGQKTMSKYMSENVKALRERVLNAINAGTDMSTFNDFTPIGSSRFAANVFVIAKGTLPEITSEVVEESTVYTQNIAVSGNTYQDVIDSLGLQRGDQLTFVQIVNPMTSGSQTQFKFARVILDPYLDGEQADLSTPFIENSQVNAANPRNEGIIRSIEFDTDHLEIKLTAQNLQAIVAAAAIASRKVNDSWKRSKAQLVLGSAAQTNAVSFADAVSQSEGSIDALSDRYLNNAASGSLVNFNESGVSPSPRMTGVVVNGTTIAASGTTSIAANAASIIIISGNNAAVEGALRASYRIGSGAWATPIALNSAGNASFSGVNLSSGVVSFALGTGSTAASFSPSLNWGGTATVQVPTIAGVTVNNTSIGSTGSTNVVENASSTIRIATVNCDGKYAAYKIGSGAWSNPVAVNSDVAQFTGVSLSSGDSVSFAVGTGATTSAFQAELNYGGTANVIETPAASFSNVTFAGSAWNSNLTVSSVSANDQITGSWDGSGDSVLIMRDPSNVDVGDTVQSSDASLANVGTIQSGGSFSLTAGKSSSDQNYYYLFAASEDGNGNYVVTGKYQYYIETEGL